MKSLNETASGPPSRPSDSRRVAGGEVREEEKVIVRAEDVESVSVPRPKPPHVPFYENEEERRRRQDPTAVIPRPPVQRPAVAPPPSAMMADDDPASPLRRSGLGFIVMVVILAVLGVGFAALARRRVHHDDARPAAVTTATATAVVTTVLIDTAPPSSSSPAPAPASATAVASAAPSTGAAAEETVLTIETIPARSAVFIDGAKVGVSPMELKVPKSNEAIRLELRHPGYVALREQVVPDINQRLRLTLTPGRGGPGASGTASAVPYHKFE